MDNQQSAVKNQSTAGSAQGGGIQSIGSTMLRSLPHNLEAEQSVIGSMLIDKHSIAQAVEVLKAEDFYRDSHKVIFSAIWDLFRRDEPIDMVTLLEHQ